MGDYPRNGGGRHSLLLAGEDALSPAKDDVFCGLAVFTVGAVETEGDRHPIYQRTCERDYMYNCIQRAVCTDSRNCCRS